MDNDKYGILLNSDAKLYRKYFLEMCKLLGVQAIYKGPRQDKHYNLQGEIKSNYLEPVKIGVIYQDHVDQKTSKLLGWDAELNEQASIIHVPYELPQLQIGALFELPSAIDNSEWRLFRVTKMSTTAIYPTSVACEIVPEYESTLPEEEVENFENSDFNLLNQW